MITLVNGNPQNAQGLIVPNGSISLQLNVDGTIIAAPYGLVLAAQPAVFQFNSSGHLLAGSQIWSNLELDPQNGTALGTWYTVNFYDANQSRLNDAEMTWQFNNVNGATVDIGTMISTTQATVYYPFGTIGIQGPQGPAGVGGSYPIIVASQATYTAGCSGDFGCAVSNALAAAYVLGGGTVDARGFACPSACNIGQANLMVGNGVAPVTLLLPAGTITRQTIAATGKSAQIYYNSFATIIGEGMASTIISGPSDVTAVQQTFGNGVDVSEASLSNFSIADTGGVVSGSVGLQIGGPVPGGPAMQSPVATTYGFNYIGNLVTYAPSPSLKFFFNGRMAQFAIYNKALTPTQITNHYNAGINAGSTYISTVTADGPIAFWSLTETTGTSAADSIGARNGTYTGGVTLGTAAGIPGDAGSFSALMDGTSGCVALPSAAWFSGGDWTLEGWVYMVSPPVNQAALISFSNASSLTTGTDAVYMAYAPAGDHLYTAVWVNGVYQANSSSDTFIAQGAWTYCVIVIQGNEQFNYINGTLEIFRGTDVIQSTFENINVSGSDIGLQMNGQQGCVCYNKLTNVSPSGASIGARALNSSGFGFSVNQNQWHGGQLAGPIGLWDSGTFKNTYEYLDFELNSSSTGAILYVLIDPNNAGSGYSVGNTSKPGAGNAGNGDAVITIAAVSSGVPTAVTITTPGTGYGNSISTLTTTLTGGGSGMHLDIRTSAYMLLVSSGSSMIVNPYEEAGAGDYICGSGNFVFGAWSSSNGSKYSATYCSGNTTRYSGPGTAFVWGPGSTPVSIGLAGQSGFIAYDSLDMFDDLAPFALVGGSSYPVNLYANGPIWAGMAAQTYGFYGHSSWSVGTETIYAGTIASGRAKFSALATPSVPVLTAVGGTGTVSAAYGLVCNDGNGGSTVAASPVTTISGPATLGAVLTVAVASGGTSYPNSGTATLTGGDGTATVSFTATGGVVQTVTLGTAGSRYNSVPYPGSGGSNVVATTTGGAGTGLTVQITSSYIQIAFPVEDGCQSWTTLITDTSHQLQQPSSFITGSTNVAANIIDFGGSSVAYTAAVRNTTGDFVLAGANHTPASSSELCTTGSILWDSGYIYVCTSTNTWKRTALASF